MVGYYRGFCENFATVVTPLTNILSVKVPFHWTDASQQAFEAAKALLSSAPVLAAPTFEKPFKLAADASDCGAVVLSFSRWVPMVSIIRFVISPESSINIKWLTQP